MKTGDIDTDQRHRIATAEIKQRITANLGRRHLHRSKPAEPRHPIKIEH